MLVVEKHGCVAVISGVVFYNGMAFLILSKLSELRSIKLRDTAGQGTNHFEL